LTAFHEVLFPLDIALGSRGGPQRRTDVVTLGSGREERNQRWAHSRRRYNAGYGVKSFDALASVVAFFEERRGRLYGFRWRDRADCKSCAPAATPSGVDQIIGAGDGATTGFQLVKTYGAHSAPYVREIRKPVAGSVRLAIDGVELDGADFSCDPATGMVTIAPGHAPAPGAVVSAGFVFDVPVRFDTDSLEIDYAAFDAGAIPEMPIVEIIL